MVHPSKIRKGDMVRVVPTDGEPFTALVSTGPTQVDNSWSIEIVCEPDVLRDSNGLAP